MANVSERHLTRMYEDMVTTRYYEERLQEEYLKGKQPAFDISAGPIPGGFRTGRIGRIRHL